MGKTLREIFDNAIQILNIEKGDNSPPFIRERVVTDINAALQLLQTAPKDHFQREEITLNLVNGTNAYDLAAEVINVLLPVRIGSDTLTEITSRGEFDRFGQIYLGQTNTSGTRAKPMAVYVQRRRRTGNADPSKTQILFAPTPNATYTAKVEVTKTPPAYTVADLADPSPEVPVPHEFSESILLPIVRWNVRTSHFFSRQDLLSSMAEEYAKALDMLGLSNPKIDHTAEPDAMERKKAAARDAARRAYNATT